MREAQEEFEKIFEEIEGGKVEFGKYPSYPRVGLSIKALRREAKDEVTHILKEEYYQPDISADTVSAMFGIN